MMNEPEVDGRKRQEDYSKERFVILREEGR